MFKKTIVYILFMLFSLFLGNNIINAYIDLNTLYETDSNLIGKSILVPMYLKLVSYDLYDSYNNVKIIGYDGHNEKEIYKNNVKFNKEGLAKIIIEVSPKDFDINSNMIFKVYINDGFVGQIKKNILQIGSYISDDAKYLLDNKGKILTIEDFIDIDTLNNNQKKIKDKIKKYKSNKLKYTEIKDYAKTVNGKINASDLPFDMGNLACNITESDLSYIESKTGKTIDRQKIVYAYPCKDGMIDLKLLLTIVKTYNKEAEILNEYKK